MRLTVYTDYALRMLMYLALKDDGLATISEVAARYGVSKNHLMKVAHQLGLAGYIDTVRGRSGGLRLARPMHEIGLGEVVRHTEQDIAVVPCFEVGGACTISSCCGLRGALNRATEAFFDVLDEYSLADLIKPRAPLQRLLAIDLPGEPRKRGGQSARAQ